MWTIDVWTTAGANPTTIAAQAPATAPHTQIQSHTSKAGDRRANGQQLRHCLSRSTHNQPKPVWEASRQAPHDALPRRPAATRQLATLPLPRRRTNRLRLPNTKGPRRASQFPSALLRALGPNVAMHRDTIHRAITPHPSNIRIQTARGAELNSGSRDTHHCRHNMVRMQVGCGRTPAKRHRTYATSRVGDELLAPRSPPHNCFAARFRTTACLAASERRGLREVGTTHDATRPGAISHMHGLAP